MEQIKNPPKADKKMERVKGIEPRNQLGRLALYH